MVMKACSWMTSEASPTGMPRPIARNSRPNCPTPIEQAVENDELTVARGGLTNRIAGKRREDEAQRGQQQRRRLAHAELDAR